MWLKENKSEKNSSNEILPKIPENCGNPVSNRASGRLYFLVAGSFSYVFLTLTLIRLARGIYDSLNFEQKQLKMD
jgi:hypothetical protein